MVSLAGKNSVADNLLIHMLSHQIYSLISRVDDGWMFLTTWPAAMNCM